MLKENFNVPYQVQTVIDSLLGTEDIYVRGNYRQRLDQIRSAINESIGKYDKEVSLHISVPKKKRR